MLRKSLVAFLCAALTLTAGPVFAANNASSRPEGATNAPAPAQPGSIARTRPGSESDIKRYQAREQASPDAAKFRGGHEVVVISAGTVALVLVIVLLVILL